MTPETAKTWTDVLSTQGGWGVAVIVGIVLGAVIVWLARRYETFREKQTNLFIDMIKNQTELLTVTKIQNESIIEIMGKVSHQLDTKQR